MSDLQAAYRAGYQAGFQVGRYGVKTQDECHECYQCGQKLGPGWCRWDTGEPITECFECWQKRHKYRSYGKHRKPIELYPAPTRPVYREEPGHE